MKVAGIIFGSILCFVLFSSLLLYLFLEPIAGHLLKEQVNERTDGLYILTFDDLQLNLLTRTLTLQQLHLYPDSAVHQQQLFNGAANPLLLQVKTPLFRISGIDLAAAVFENRVDIGSLEIKKPTIILVADEKNKAITERDKGTILGSMKSVFIDKIELQDAKIRYLTRDKPDRLLHEVRHVSLLLQDFNFSPRGQPDPALQVDIAAVQLQIKDYAYYAPDSVYQLQVGSLFYSSEQKTLLTEAVALLAANKETAAPDPEEANRTLYNLTFPALRMTGLDLIKAYHTKEIKTDSFLLEKPELAIMLPLKNTTGKAPPDVEAIYKDIADHLKLIDIGELRVANGNIKIKEKLAEAYTVHEWKGAELALQEVRLDSSTLFSPKENFFAKTVLASATGYTYQHPDNPHRIVAGKMELSTQGHYFHVDSLRVIGDKRKNERLKLVGRARPVIYNLQVPALHFSDMELKQALQTSRLKIGMLHLMNPSMELERDKSVAKAQRKSQLVNTYAAVSDLVTALVIEKINIQDASFTQFAGTKPIQELKHASLTATGLEIDSAYVFSPSEGGIPVKEVLLLAHNYTFRTRDNLYTLTLGRLRYSTVSQVLAARSIELTSDKAANNAMMPSGNANRNLYDITASQFRVTGLDLIKVIKTGELHVDQMVLRESDFAMLKDRSITATPTAQQRQGALDDVYSIVDPIKVNTFRLEDGTFTYREKWDDVIHTQLLEHASATVSGINLSAARTGALVEALPMREMTLTARDYTYRSPAGIYTVALDSLHYSSRQQELTARRLAVVSDKDANARLQTEKSEEANRTLFDISALKFRITGLDLIRSYETGNYAMTEMLLTAPEVTILQNRNVPAQKEGASEKEEQTDVAQTLQQLAAAVETFRVEHLRVDDGNFRFNILQDTVLTSQRIEHVSVAIEQLRTTSVETTDPLEMFRAEDIGVLVRNYAYYLPDSLYLLKVGEVSASLRQQALYIKGLRLLPLYNKNEFVSRITYENDYFDLHVPYMLLQGMDLPALFNNQDIILEKALISNPVMDIYRDKRLPEDPNRRPPTLQEMLRQADYFINVDTVTIEAGRLTYSEVAPNGLQPGILLFENTNLEALHITNAPAPLLQDSVVRVYGSTQLMGESKLNARFKFYLHHPEDLYTYEGTLEPMDFRAFNPLFMHLLYVRIEEGQIAKAAFAVKATEHYAVGQMRFFYHDLTIQLIDKEAPEAPGLVQDVGSWLLNKLVIKSNNPAGRRDLRVGNIAVDRDYQKSIFNHISKAMIDGITTSLMVPFVENVADDFVEF